MKFSIFLWAVWLVYFGASVANQVLSNIEASESFKEDYDENDERWSMNRSGAFGYITNAASIAFGVAMTWLAMTVRRMVRMEHHIPGEQLEDCCLAFWCHACVASQILRQIKLDNGQYELCSPTGNTGGARAV